MHAIPSGKPGTHVSDAYDDGAFEKMIQSLRPSYDLIFIDAAPIVPVVEPIMMAEHVDGILLIAMAGRTPITMIRRMRGILAPVESKVAGAIVNNATEGLPYYYDYSYYGYKPLLSRRDRNSVGGVRPRQAGGRRGGGGAEEPQAPPPRPRGARRENQEQGANLHVAPQTGPGRAAPARPSGEPERAHRRDRSRLRGPAAGGRIRQGRVPRHRASRSTRSSDALNRGISYIQDVPTRASAAWSARGCSGHHRVRRAGEDLDVVDICVPTPLRKTKDPDISYIVAAVEAIAQRLQRGQLVVLESTTYPGTTDELVLPMLEGGLQGGQGLLPRVLARARRPGEPTLQTSNIPKVVGGVTPDCTGCGALYGAVIDTIVPVGSTRVAEMVKLLENTFRA